MTTPPPPPKVNTKKARLAGAILHLWDEQVPIADIARRLDCGQNTVRRALDAQRPGERAVRSASTTETERPCVGCGQIFPLDQFPPRSDRPGKRHARCFTCLRDWRRGWQTANPERNREGVRRRRARLRKARTEPYRDLEIFERDEGVCWFCHLPVDPTLKYPDRKSMVVHHLHPIAKMGPDIKKNVALAHYDCNQAEKDRYVSPFAGWVVSAVPVPLARETVVAHHYLHRYGPISHAFGLFDQHDALRGVVTFGSPTSQRVTRSVLSQESIDQGARVLELNRLWIEDAVPFGGGSWFLSRALQQLPTALIVSYADTSIQDPRHGEAHSGAVYRACSFRYAGTSRPNTEWRMPGGTRNVGKAAEGSVRVEVSPKSRYWTVTGTQRQKRALRRLSQWPDITYSNPVRTQIAPLKG